MQHGVKADASRNNVPPTNNTKQTLYGNKKKLQSELRNKSADVSQQFHKDVSQTVRNQKSR
jgi:hypothetical protein